jgi:ribonuclease HII
VIADLDTVTLLANHGIKDSKMLTPLRRRYLYDVIKKHAIVRTLHISALDIDTRRKNNENLNEIERSSSVALLQQLDLLARSETRHAFDELYLDSVDIDTARWASSFAKTFPHAKVVSEHKADSKYVLASHMHNSISRVDFRSISVSSNHQLICTHRVGDCRRSFNRCQSRTRYGHHQIVLSPW